MSTSREPASSRSGWRRTFWVVFASNLIAGAGLMAFLPFFPTLLEELGMQDEHARTVWSGILFGAAPLAAAFSGPVWGSIGDRYGRKWMVVRSMLGLTLFVGLMGCAQDEWQLLFLRIMQGVFSGYMPPSLTLVSVAAPEERQGQVTSWIQTASTVGTILGPMIGALILGVASARAVFAVTGIGAGVSAVCVWWLAVEDTSRLGARGPLSLGNVLRSTWSDVVELLANARLREAMVLYAAVHFALGATNPLMEFFVELVWRGAPARIESLTASLFSVLALSAIVATPLWGRLGDRLGHAVALRLASALSAVALILHAFVPSYAWLFVVRLIFGLASPGASAAAFGLAATETGRESRGAAMGAVFSARSFALSFGSFAGGALATALGLRGLFAAAGVVIALGLLARRRG
ncbi:MAG: MFS transporter [Planctomycetes bacterium]|nr:MFS transporter [Planctomycetota bacterium]